MNTSSPLRVDLTTTARLRVAQIEEFLIAFLPDEETVRAAAERRTPALDETAVAIEDHHSVMRLAGRVDGVVNIDVPLRIDTDAVGVAVLDVGRERAPIMRDFVGVVSGPENGFGGAGFVLRAQE